MFTTANVDNIDHNPSARTAKDSFHGTAVSLTQHPSTDRGGIARGRVVISPESPKKKTLTDLPESYTDVQPVAVQVKKDCYVPKGCKSGKPSSDLIGEGMKSEYQWLHRVKELLEKDRLDKEDYISWSAYFASLQSQAPRSQAITALLPLFHENAHTMTMIQHSMKIVKESVAYVNSNQTPVIAMDQPLFAIAKQIQWEKADLCGEEKYVVMMGGLHVEMASLEMVGHWLDKSGWDRALEQADITARGRVDGILKAAHITRSRYAHQVSACALYILQRKAYKEYTASHDSSDIDFETWLQEKTDHHPHFQYWATVLKLELTILEFVRSIREGNFHVYVEILGKLTSWMFALDLTNYSRWLPVHIRDPLMRREKHPSVFAEFVRRNFVVQKTQHVFSLIALDHNHEQENEIIKGDGGAVGLTENPTALKRWMVAGPEIARVVKEIESTFEVTKPLDKRHHEQMPSVQKAFSRTCKHLLVY